MEKSARNKAFPPSFHAVIVAGGSGTRLGASLPKQYIRIGGKAILRHTIESFLKCPGLAGLVVVIDPAHEALYNDAVGGLNLPPPVVGGVNRKISVMNGINSFSHLEDENVILIHDAARPFVKTGEISAVVEAVVQCGAATLAAPVSDTLSRADTHSYVDRNGLWAVQTPQGFHYGLIREAHELDIPNPTDDTALVASMGHDIRFVEGSRENFKITTRADLDLAEKLMSARKTVTRTGTGFDVHAFDYERKAGSVRVCGIDVPHDHGLAGHSDADVGLHALTDALLGAIAAGDIGQHFPPSDPQWKGADSALFLAHAVKMVADFGGEIINMDLTLICEAPKMGPYRKKMQARVAEICGLSPDQVGIKATTTEKLGFTGRKEGIAAQAAVSIEVCRAVS